VDDFASCLIQLNAVFASLLQSIKNKNFVNDGIGVGVYSQIIERDSQAIFMKIEAILDM
jgi:hypothetical protein